MMISLAVHPLFKSLNPPLVFACSSMPHPPLENTPSSYLADDILNDFKVKVTTYTGLRTYVTLIRLVSTTCLNPKAMPINIMITAAYYTRPISH